MQFFLAEAWKLSIENKDNDITSLNNFAASLSQSKEKHIESLNKVNHLLKYQKILGVIDFQQ